jgi:hypothetical protein
MPNEAKHPDVDGKLMIGFASESWKSDPMAAFIKEKVLEMKKEIISDFRRCCKAEGNVQGDPSE